jgi:hypothetical protein
MAKKGIAKRRAQQRARRRTDLTVRRAGIKGGSSISDSMAEARARVATAKEAAMAQMATGIISAVAGTASAASAFTGDTTTTKKKP